MSKYRILYDHKSRYSQLRYVPQVFDGAEWKSLDDLTSLDTAELLIKAHQHTGSQYSVFREIDPATEPAPRPGWFKRIFGWVP